MMIEHYVFELDPKTFRLMREINANRARWQQNIQQWVWEQDRFSRDVCGVVECNLQNFTVPRAFPRSPRPLTTSIQVKQNQQMNYSELDTDLKYLHMGLREAEAPRSILQEIRALLLFALIMAFIVPFGFSGWKPRRYGRYRHQHCRSYGLSGRGPVIQQMRETPTICRPRLRVAPTRCFPLPACISCCA